MQSVSSPACRVVPLGPCPDSPSLLSLSILQVCSSSSKLYGYSFIKWYRELVERIALDLWILAFNCNVPIDLVSLGSFMLFSSTYVVLMRPFTAVCSPVTVFNPVVVGAVFLCSPWWQVKVKLTVMYPPVNMSMSGIYFPAASYLEQFLFPICPHMLSDLDEQASLLVLQGLSSQLMLLFSANGAEFVALWVTQGGAVQKEVYEIIVRFLMVSFSEMYRQSIFLLTMCWFVLALCGLVVSSSRG